MDALDRFLTAPGPRPCGECRHAHPSVRDGLYCHREKLAPYPCAVERGSSPLEARLYGACGSRGRFFEAKTAATPAWAAPTAVRSHRPLA